MIAVTVFFQLLQKIVISDETPFFRILQQDIERIFDIDGVGISDQREAYFLCELDFFIRHIGISLLIDAEFE